jgi:hypothetical protein
MRDPKRMTRKLLATLALLLSLAAVQRPAHASVQDGYSALIQWTQPSGWEVTPIHVGLLPSGSLFFVNEYNFPQHPGKNLADPAFVPEFMFLMDPTPLGATLPTSVPIQIRVNESALTRTVDAAAGTIEMKSLVCSGHALMEDGTLMFAGGPHAYVNLSLYNAGFLSQSLTLNGIAESTTYDSSIDAWIRNPDTIVAGPSTHQPLRWYPTITKLADSRMLVTGGYEKVLPTLAYNASVEAFDPRTNAWQAVSNPANTPPGIENPDYTHVWQDPSDDRILVLGGSGEPLILDLSAPSPWQSTAKFRPGAKEFIASSTDKVFPNFSSSSAMLPIRLPGNSWGYANGSIINVGGAPNSPLGTQIDVYDPAANSWRATIQMPAERHHPSAVILPDGRILVIAGWSDETTEFKQTGYALYVDPKNNFATARGSAYMPETRGYHTVSVLLPDGRVLVGSGNIDGNDEIERTDFRYYYPDYIFATRPVMATAPDTIDFGASGLVSVPHGTSVGEADLVALGSQTHSFDMNQRHVQVQLAGPLYTIASVGGTWTQVPPAQCTSSAPACYDTYSIQAPSTADTAPPGYYILFILDSNRIPSIGKVLKLGPREPDCTVLSHTATSGLYGDPLVVAPGRAVTFEAHCNYAASDPAPTFSWNGAGTTFATTVTAASTPGAVSMYTVTVSQFGKTRSYAASVSTTATGTPSCTISQQPPSPTAFTPVSLTANCPEARTFRWTTGMGSSSDVRGADTANATVFNVVNPASPASAGVDLVVSNGPGIGALVESNLQFSPSAPSCRIVAAPPGTVPPGGSVSLTAECDGQPTAYTWSTGATTRSISVTPSATTEYTVAANSDAGALPAVRLAIPVASSMPALRNFTGHWWGGTDENGWGATLNQHGSIVFGVIYFYDPSGRPAWAVMPGGTWDATNTVFTGDLYVPTGAPYNSYDASQFAANAAMGTATLSFSDAGTLYISATMGYAPADRSGRHTTFFQKKLAPLIVNGGAAPNGVNYGDMWWGGVSENGWGIAINQSAAHLFAAWFTYASDGRPTWFIFDGNTWNGGTVSGSVLRTSGAPMLGTVYDPALFKATTAGTGAMAFTANGSGTFNYMIDGVAGSKAIVKQPF